MVKHSFLLLLLFFLSNFSFSQSSLSQTRTCTGIRLGAPEFWTQTAWQNVSADDNRYISTKQLKGGTSRPISFIGFGFSIPSTATIQRIDVKIIRFKSGKNNVKDFYCALQTGYSENNYGGAFPNMAKTSYWPTQEAAITYSNAPGGTGTNGVPYQWTPALINAPYFGLFFDIGFVVGGPGAIANIEQVQITVYYTNVTTTAKTSQEQSNDFEVKQVNNRLNIFIADDGPYQLQITDYNGRVLQQETISNKGQKSILLNQQSKGLCIIRLQGKNGTKTIKTFIK